MNSEQNDSLRTFVLFSLGSNVGDRQKNIDRAVAYVRETDVLEGIKVSSCYETEPFGYQEQAWFLNAAMSGYTRLDINSLMLQVKNIEYAVGRIGRDRWHEREIDIDILLYGSYISFDSKLTIPHPGMHARKFVLMPAAEIEPAAVHPVLGLTIKEMLDICADKSIVRFNIAS